MNDQNAESGAPDVDMTEHSHQWRSSYDHTHAWGSEQHGHILRAVCLRRECRGCETHDIHPAPAHIDSSES